MHRPRLALAAVAALASCTVAACSSSGPDATRSSAPRAVTTPASSPTAPTSTPTTSAAAPRSTTAPTTTPASSTKPVARPSTRSPSTRSPSTHVRAASAPRRLPLAGTTGGADQVITVVASSHGSTTATLQAWHRVSGGWRTTGPSVTAHLGSGGVGRASEGSTKTPAGSFSLTQAFGHDSDPGTRLPYTHTTPDDWWISQSSSPLYNTRQRCASHCGFTRGDPNEHLFYETPYYNYAVVIDYNTRNAPGGVQAGAGSAFFLHVTDGGPTAGCVSIPQDRLVAVLRWLRPADHPRIVIGVA